MFIFNGFAEILVWFKTEDGVPQGGGVYNSPGEKFM